MRRLLLPAVLVVALVGCTTVAALREADRRSTPAPVEEAVTVTPVLSARRTPELVAGPVANSRLASRLEDLATQAGGAICLVVDAGSRNLISHRADAGMIPASNQKLLTAAAAIEVLGPDTTFTTRAMAAGAPAGGVIEGDLFLVGGGDPVLATEPYAALSSEQQTAHTSFESLADAIVGAGVRSVTGGVIGVETRFDATRYNGGWPERFITQNQTGPLSALSVDDGFAEYPTPEQVGDPPPVFSNSWSGLAVPSPDPARTAANRLIGLLELRGVDVAGGPGTGAAPEGVVDVASIESAPVSELVAQMLTFSDDQTAELLLKSVGVRAGTGASTAGGSEAMVTALEAQGVNLAGSEVVDASGLAGGNRVTCELVAGILRVNPLDSPLAQGLAVAGEPGTLQDAFLGSGLEGRLRGKTGSLNEVRALSGFVEVAEGDDLTFSFIVNGNPVTEQQALLREFLGVALATYPERPPVDELDPEPLPEEGQEEEPAGRR